MKTFSSFSTKAILFRPRYAHTRNLFELFKERLKLELHFKMLNTVFIDETDRLTQCFYVQFDTDFELREFVKSVLNYVYDENVIYEYCFNFQLKNNCFLDFS